MTDAEVRCEMVRAAISDDSRFELSRLDLDRPPPSYTVDLLRSLRRADQALFFIVGADILPELPRWHAVDEIMQLATLVVVTRPGAAVRQPPGGVRELRTPGVDISSTDLRERVRQGKPITYLTPPWRRASDCRASLIRVIQTQSASAGRSARLGRFAARAWSSFGMPGGARWAKPGRPVGAHRLHYQIGRNRVRRVARAVQQVENRDWSAVGSTHGLLVAHTHLAEAKGLERAASVARMGANRLLARPFSTAVASG